MNINAADVLNISSMAFRINKFMNVEFSNDVGNRKF